MNIYAVGGAIRDELLGVPVQDRDYVVVGATPEQMAAQGSGRSARTSRYSCIRARRRSTRSRAPSARRRPAITASSSITRRT